jgi:tetratricopeptide (TPR) repeat protein
MAILWASEIVSSAIEPFHIGIAPGENYIAVKLTNDASNEMLQGHYAIALEKVNAAIRQDPTLWPAFFIRAEIFNIQRRYEDALRDCNEVLQQHSEFAAAGLLRAEVNSDLGNFAAALKELDHVISLRPKPQYLAMAYWSRARIYAGCPDSSVRNGKQALNDATVACKMTFWKDATAIDALACADAELGDFDSAIRNIRTALVAEKLSAVAAKRIQKHLALFEQHRPFRIAVRSAT